MDVLLVTMPLSPIDGPALGVTLLAGCLKRAGFTARVHYSNIRFARAIGQPIYDNLALSWLGHTALAGEWIFSRLLDPAGSADDYLATVRRQGAADVWLAGESTAVAHLAARLPALVEQAGALLDELEAVVASDRPRIVGFSSSFQQHVASLAAAKRIKERFPDTFTVLGGSNCTGVMGHETFVRFPFLDAVVSGPGEIAMVDIARDVLGEPCAGAGRRLPMTRAGATPGVYRRSDGSDVPPVAMHAVESALDELPIPDYSDFIEQAGPLARTVFIEASRGCWWGQKHHCVFCSENADSLRYRSKSPSRMVDELRALHEQYPEQRIHFTDEILDPRMVTPLAEGVRAFPTVPKMFLSAKANLKKREIALLAESGLDAIQPGIESLDDEILGPMRKGVTTIQNVQLLKWCREFGIAVHWAILGDFPYETADSYQRMARLIPLLTHLSPPHFVRVVLQRFSPLYFDAASFGVTDLSVNESYRHIYALDAAAVDNLAYRFTAGYQRDPARSWWATVRDAVELWRATVACLFYTEDGARLCVGDTCAMATRFVHVLTGLDRAIYLACDRAMTLRGVTAAVEDACGGATEPVVAAALARLQADGLVMYDRGRYLALAHRLTERSLPPVDVMVRFLTASTAQP